MYLKKLKTLLLCTALTLTLCSCNTDDRQNAPAASQADNTADLNNYETISPAPTSEEIQTVPITNKALGYSFSVAPETAELLVCGTNSDKTTESDLTFTCMPYYLNLGGFSQYAFTIYQIEGNATDDELIQHSPSLHLLAKNTTYTYAIACAEETPADLTPEDSQVYATILYKEIPELANHFHIL